MNKEDIVRMAQETGVTAERVRDLVNFAALVASAEREKLEGQIQTLNAMYEVASKQRDALMDQQRADIAAVRGNMQ